MRLVMRERSSTRLSRSRLGRLASSHLQPALSFEVEGRKRIASQIALEQSFLGDMLPRDTTVSPSAMNSVGTSGVRLCAVSAADLPKSTIGELAAKATLWKIDQAH